MGLAVGDLVIAPLGPQVLMGVVSALKDAAGHNRPLKPILERREAPRLPKNHPGLPAMGRRRYAVDAPGQPLAISLRGARAPKARPERLIVATGPKPARDDAGSRAGAGRSRRARCQPASWPWRPESQRASSAA